jgi:hypothetical protein
MRNSTLRARFVTFLATAVCLAACAMANTVIVNFDSVVIAPGTWTDATSYLSSYGIGFIGLSNAASAAIFNPSWAFTAASNPNIFAANGKGGNADLSYELTFSEALVSFSFTRVAEVSTSTLPPYTVSALDSLGNVLDSMSEPHQLGTAAHTFTLNGPGIAAIRMDAHNWVAATVTDPPLDDFVLVTAGVPEPATLALTLGGLAVLAVFRRGRRREGR